MRSLYTTLSLRYLRRRWSRALLIVLSIAAGVSMLVATRALNLTMDQAAAASTTPFSAVADLIVSNGEAPVDRDLAIELRKVDGVQAAHPRIFARVKLPELNDRPALLIGIDLASEQHDKSATRWQVEYDKQPLAVVWSRFAARKVPVIVGKNLEEALPQKPRDLRVQGPKLNVVYVLRRAGTITGEGPGAALAGDVLVMKLNDNPGAIIGLKRWQVSRIDLTLQQGADRAAVQKRVAAVLAGRGEVRTPEEQNQTVQNVMTSLQTGLLLCGVAALVVGLFLVYNALAVNVAERRHEIGMLRGLGATRGQVVRLFAGEAALLGLVGSLLGIPLGLAAAHLSLQPMQALLSKVFFAMDATEVQISVELLLAAVAAGMLTAVAAALMPALLAAREKPAAAVRRIPPLATWRRRFTQVACSAVLLLAAVGCIACRTWLPAGVGTFGGLSLVMLSALVATPLLTAAVAQLLQPQARRYLGLAGRLAADNLVRAPGRTGLVIAALAAGVALVLVTAGIIRSNRMALHDWVQETVASDLMITAGSPVSAGGQSLPMDEALGARIRKTVGAEAVLPMRVRHQLFRDTQVLMMAVNAGEVYRLGATRRPTREIEPYRVLSEQPNGALISENFSSLYGLKVGDAFTVASPNGPVTLHVVGQLVDYSWPRGSIIINRALNLEQWEDRRVDFFDVYLKPGADRRTVCAAQAAILKAHGPPHGLIVLRQDEVQGQLDETIEQFHGVSFGQQVVVIFVAGLGVLMALMISVLQRRRELGMLRAVGASRRQVIRSVLAEALLLGAIGTLIGLLVSVPLLWYALRIAMLEETGYSFPVYLPWSTSLWIALAAMTTALLAGLGPALHTTRLRIPETIAQE